jgi:hypothetical protein
VFEFDTGGRCSELPVGFGVVGIAVLLPSGDFAGEDLFVRDTAVEALGRQDANAGCPALLTLITPPRV